MYLQTSWFFRAHNNKIKMRRPGPSISVHNKSRGRQRLALSSSNSNKYKFKAVTLGAIFLSAYLFSTVTLYNKASSLYTNNHWLNARVVWRIKMGLRAYPLPDPHFDHKTRSFLEIKPLFCAEDAEKTLATASSKSGAITAVTQITADKLQRLEDLASRWIDDGGYISVAIYAPDEVTANNISDKFRLYFEDNSDLFKRMVAQLVVDKRPKGDYKNKSGLRSPHEYPVNILRNIALEEAPTDHIMYVDVDFIPSVGAHSHLVQQLSLMDVSMKKEKMVLILPAFERKLSKLETESSSSSSSSMESFHLPSNKEELLPFVTGVDVNNIIAPFHLEEFPPGHGPTQFPKWYTATETYQVDYDYQFEPYFVINKVDMPLFWEYFRGRYCNKFSWVGELFLAGYSFYVNPSSFLIHINHEYSHSPGDSETTNHYDKMYQEFDERFNNGYLREKYGRIFEERDDYDDDDDDGSPLSDGNED